MYSYGAANANSASDFITILVIDRANDCSSAIDPNYFAMSSENMILAIENLNAGADGIFVKQLGDVIIIGRNPEQILSSLNQSVNGAF